MTIMLAAKIGIALGFLAAGLLARVIYRDEQRDRAPVSRRAKR